MSSPQILVSRRTLQRLKPKYPKLFNPPKGSGKSAAKETPWPRYMQIAGYTAAGIAVPYAMSVLISESNTLRTYLEGECDETHNGSSGENMTIGRKIVSYVRWYWGIEDEIPYQEYLELKLKDGKSSTSAEEELSMIHEDKTIYRKIQDQIERDSHAPLKVEVENDGIIKEDVFKGNIPMSEQLQLTSSEKEKFDISKNIYVEFQDDIATIDDNSNDSTSSSNLDDLNFVEESTSTAKDIGNRATTYTLWNYVPSPSTRQTAAVQSNSNKNNGNNNNNKPSASPYDSTQIRIEELQHNITDLQKLLTDPSCTRDRDDMEKEVKDLKRELSQIKREKRFAKLKKFVPF
jgi:hypothetical protein